MKIRRILVLVLALLFLSGCGLMPVQTMDGAQWDRDWLGVGTVLGISPLGHDLELVEKEDMLAFGSIYYATWSAGEGEAYEGGEEDEKVYPLQVYLLIQQCKDGGDPEGEIALWQKVLQETNEVTGSENRTVNEQAYTTYTYNNLVEGNPYQRGAAAFTVRGVYAISVEVLGMESYTGDLEQVLSDFLSCMHYR